MTRSGGIHITVCAVAQHCCKGDERFQWEMPFFRVFQLRNPRTDFFSKNFAQLITSATPPHKQKFESVGPKGVCLRMREVVIVRRLFFLGFLGFFLSFMRIATGPPVGPIILVNGLNDAAFTYLI